MDSVGQASLELENRQGLKSLVDSNLTLSRPKFSPSQETTLSFIVEFRALRTVDLIRPAKLIRPAVEKMAWHGRLVPVFPAV